MTPFGPQLRLKSHGSSWVVQKLIPKGRHACQFGVWRNGKYLAAEASREAAIAFVDHWPRTPPKKLARQRSDELCDRRRGEKVGDIDAALRLWLLDNDPTYKAELEGCMRGITFGRKAR